MGVSSNATAQQTLPPHLGSAQPIPANQLRPVPRLGHEGSGQAANQSSHTSRDLSWRKSTTIGASPAATTLQIKPAASETSRRSVIRQVSGEISIGAAQDNSHRASSSRRTQHHSGLQLTTEAPTLHPINHQDITGRQRITATSKQNQSDVAVSRVGWNGGSGGTSNQKPDYFANPFSEQSPQATPGFPNNASPDIPRHHLRERPLAQNGQGRSLELRPANELRMNVAQLELPSPDSPTPPTKSAQPALPATTETELPDTSEVNPLPSTPAKSEPAAKASPQTDTAPVPKLALPQQSTTKPAEKQEQAKPEASLGDILQQRSPSSEETRPKSDNSSTVPSLQGDTAGSSKTFGEQLRNADQRDRDLLNRGQGRRGGYGVGGDVLEDLPFSCEDFRQRIAAQTIDKVSLDISPPYRPDEMDEKRYQNLKEEFDEKQSIRTWHDRNGNALLTGRLNDLAYEKAVIETNDGSKDALPINQLSEGDIAYIAENWGLPKECLIEQVAYTPRQWTASTMTWKASNLCHHPLYFEDVNLERYGHTRGPVLEPFVQSAHFFANIAVLPYKMGVHCPSECEYALGYYRPGNCAPWIKPPVPISARGAIAQAATMTGMFWLIP